MNAIQSRLVLAASVCVCVCVPRQEKRTMIAKPECFLQELHSSGSQKQSVT